MSKDAATLLARMSPLESSRMARAWTQMYARLCDHREIGALEKVFDVSQACVTATT